MSAVTINLTGKLAEFIDDCVASGAYGSTAEAVQDAVRLMSDAHERKVAALRAALDEGVADIEAGRVSTRSVQQIADEVL